MDVLAAVAAVAVVAVAPVVHPAVAAAIDPPHDHVDRHLSTEQRWAIIAHWKDGKSVDEVVAKLHIGQ